MMHEFLSRDAARKPFDWKEAYERIEDVVLPKTIVMRLSH